MRNMKRIAIVLAAALVTGVAIFYACEKEHITNPVTGTPQEAIVEEKDYEAQIEELIAFTGIDIYKLSELEEVQKVADKQVRMMNLAQEKGTLTDAKKTQIKTFTQSIQNEYNKGNYEKVLKEYESLSAICMTVDGFIPEMNKYGVQTFTYDPNKASVQIPVTYIETQRATAATVTNAIQTASPQFATLAAPIQTQVVTATLYTSMQRSIMASSQAKEQCKTCREKAKEAYDLDCAKLLATATAGMAVCGAIGWTPIGWACAAYVSGKFISGCIDANDVYNYRVKLCDLQGYY